MAKNYYEGLSGNFSRPWAGRPIDPAGRGVHYLQIKYYSARYSWGLQLRTNLGWK